LTVPGGQALGAVAAAVALAAPAAAAASPQAIDPSIAFARTLAGSGPDAARAVAVDREGDVYVTGETGSADFPATRRARRAPAKGGAQAFVAKLDARGKLVYATLLGGDRYSSGHGIAVDRAGRAYVTGATNATDFPTTPGARRRSYGGGPFDAFVTALDARGRIRWSTFLGDTHYDEGNAIAVDRGRPVVAGRTVSPQFPRAGGLRPPVAGGAFVAKLDRSGSRLVFSTVFGGPDRGNHGNTAFGVAVDRAGATYATGITNATAFPLTRPLQPALAGAGDAFAVKIDAAGRKVVYATYLGGGADDGGRAIAADASGDAYVAGVTRSPDFPQRGALRLGARADAFVAKLDPAGRALSYAARIGGRDDDGAAAIALDDRGAAYITGRTGSTDFPGSAPGEEAQSGAFVARLARDGGSLALSSRLEGADTGLALAVDRFGAVAVAGTSGADASVAVLAPSPIVQLRRQLVARGRSANIRRLLRLGHVDLPFAAPSAGTARVSWYAGDDLVASGLARFAAPRAGRLTLRLTRAGRRRLEHARRLAITARGAFSPVDASRVRASTTFALSRSAPPAGTRGGGAAARGSSGAASR